MKRTVHESTIDARRRDNDYSLQLNRWFLTSIGAWPELSTRYSVTRNVLVSVLRFTCHALIGFTVIPAMLYIIFEEKDFRLKLKAIGPTSHCLMGGINYYSLLHNGNQIRRSIEHMENDWRMAKEHDRELMLRTARIGRVIAGICALIMQGGVISYNLARGISPIIESIDNETIAIGRLPCPSFNMILDTRFSPVYEIVLVLQFLSTVVVNNVTISACGLAAVFAMHGCGQLNVLMSRLHELVDENREVLQVSLTNIVERHLRALR